MDIFNLYLPEQKIVDKNNSFLGVSLLLFVFCSIATCIPFDALFELYLVDFLELLDLSDDNQEAWSHIKISSLCP